MGSIETDLIVVNQTLPDSHLSVWLILQLAPISLHFIVAHNLLGGRSGRIGRTHCNGSISVNLSLDRCPFDCNMNERKN